MMNIEELEPLKLTIPIEVPVSAIFDLMVIAAEGGINYWADIQKYKHHEEAGMTVVDALVVRDLEETNPEEDREVTVATIAKGIKTILEGTAMVNTSIMGDLVRGLRESDPGSWDADVADAVVQAGLFGFVVYG